MVGRWTFGGLTQDQLLRAARRSEAANCGLVWATLCAKSRIALPLQTSLIKASAFLMR
jgi:hypothetical protein